MKNQMIEYLNLLIDKKEQPIKLIDIAYQLVKAGKIKSVIVDFNLLSPQEKYFVLDISNRCNKSIDYASGLSTEQKLDISKILDDINTFSMDYKYCYLYSKVGHFSIVYRDLKKVDYCWYNSLYTNQLNKFELCCYYPLHKKSFNHGDYYEPDHTTYEIKFQ